MKVITGILFFLVALASVLLIVLCFFQFPSMDDYVGSYLIKYYGGLPGAIGSYLSVGNGRFSTIPLFLGISSSPALMAIYPWLLVFFMVIAYASIYCFVRVMGKQLFTNPPRASFSLGIAGLVLMVFLTSMPEIGSFFYWMATSVTYLFPFCLYLLLLLCYSILPGGDQKKKLLWLVITSLLTIIIAGANELMLFYSASLPFLAAGIFLASKRKIPGYVYFLSLLGAIMVIVVLQIPGNASRTHDFSHKQYLGFSIVGSFYRTIENLVYIFKNPLFYISCFGVLLISANLKPGIAEFFRKKRTNWLIEALVLLAMVFVFNLGIRQLGGAVVPNRAVNIMNCILVLGCWWIIIINSSRLVAFKPVLQQYAQPFRLLFLYAFCIAFLLSGFFFDLGKNMVVAPIHAKIMKRRILNMETARQNGVRKVVVLPYEEETDIILDSLFPSKKRFIKEEFSLPPSFSYFQDEPHKRIQAYFYAEYYGIDTIIGKEGKVLRWGLKGGDPWTQR